MINQQVTQALDALIESARLLGTTQAKKLYGVYAQTDGRFEGESYKTVESRKEFILASLVQAEQEPQLTTSIEINFKQATELLQMFCDEPTVITLITEDGHSGKGLYAYYTELAGEGTEYLGEADDEDVPDELCD